MTAIQQFSILSFFGIMGDSKVTLAYDNLLYKKWKTRELIDLYLPVGHYGKDVELILLAFLVEGSHHWFTIPDAIKFGRYGPKDKSIRVKIPMLKHISEAVLNDDVETANKFLLETFTKVGELIATSKALAKLDFDFKKFNKDYQVFMQHLLDHAPA
jgi:hypothetical protein